jgi:hypothetical protein
MTGIAVNGFLEQIKRIATVKSVQSALLIH